MLVLLTCRSSWVRMPMPVLLLLELRRTLRAVPLALWLLCEAHAGKVEPLDGALGVVAGHHLAIGYILTQAVARL